MITRFLIPSALIVAATLLFFSLTSPAWDTANVLKQQKADIATALLNAKELQKTQKALQDQRNAIGEEATNRLEKLLPDGKIDNVQLIIDINSKAIGYGQNMALRNIKMRTDDAGTNATIGPKTKKYGTATLNFSVSGPYESMKSFVNDLETSLRLIDITALSFSGADKNSYEYNFEIKTYWLK